jgi:hypothetical protein
MGDCAESLGRFKGPLRRSTNRFVAPLIRPARFRGSASIGATGIRARRDSVCDLRARVPAALRLARGERRNLAQHRHLRQMDREDAALILPQELACGSGMTCWRRLRDRQLEGVWDLIHFALIDWLARSDQIDRSRAVVDSQPRKQASPDLRRARRARRRPPDRRQSKRLARSTGPGGCISPLQGKCGRPRRRPACVLADRGTTRRRFGVGCAGVGLARS